jgi:hypothetical protein
MLASFQDLFQEEGTFLRLFPFFYHASVHSQSQLKHIVDIIYLGLLVIIKEKTSRGMGWFPLTQAIAL